MSKKLCKGSSGVGKYMKYRKFKSGEDRDAAVGTRYVPQNGICPECGEDYNMHGGCKCNGYTHGKPIETTSDGSIPYKKTVAKKVKTNLSLMDKNAVEAEIKRLKGELDKCNQFIAAIPWFDESISIKDLREAAKRCGVEVE